MAKTTNKQPSPEQRKRKLHRLAHLDCLGVHEGTIEVEGDALYLHARRDLDVAGLALSMSLPDGVVARFAPGAASVSMVDRGQQGLLAMAWLDGIALAAGERLLLGYVDGADRGKVAGISANEAAGRAVRIVSGAGFQAAKF